MSILTLDDSHKTLDELKTLFPIHTVDQGYYFTPKEIMNEVDLKSLSDEEKHQRLKLASKVFLAPSLTRYGGEYSEITLNHVLPVNKLQINLNMTSQLEINDVFTFDNKNGFSLGNVVGLVNESLQNVAEKCIMKYGWFDTDPHVFEGFNMKLNNGVVEIEVHNGT